MDDQDKIRFTIAMERVVTELLSDEIDPVTAAGRLRAGASWLDAIGRRGEQTAFDGMGVDPVPAKPGPSESEVTAVFEGWQAIAKSTRTKLTTARRKVISARLGEGFSKAKLLHVARGAVEDEWALQHARYFPEHIWVTTEKTEQNLARYGWSDRAESVCADVDIDDLRRQASEALAREDHEAYDRINDELRRAHETGD